MILSALCFFSRHTNRRLLSLFLGAAVAASVACAQSLPDAPYSSSADQSSSSLLAYHAAGQNSGGYGNGGYKQYPKYGQPGFHHLAIEAGAGFGAPLGNTAKVQTLGYNIKLGGGWNFNRRFGLLAEYEFNRGGIPNNVLAAAGAPQGTVHVWGFTLDPIVYLKNSGGWGAYVTGGGGFYRKTTAFTATQFTGQYYCDFYGYCYPDYQTIDLGHFSSNQGGMNIGAGVTHSFGESGAKLYAEARYLFVDSPSSTQGKVGSGTVSMIPVTFGIRF